MLLEGSNYVDINLNQYSHGTQTSVDSAGEMDSVVADTLDLKVVEEWQKTDEISEIREILQGGSRFQQLFIESPRLEPLPGKRSQLEPNQVLDLERMGVLQRKKKSDAPILNVVKAFTVAKPSGLRRLIVDASDLGDQMVEPYYTDLPSLDDVKRCVRTRNFVAQLDGKSWFYQFGAALLKRYFGVRTCLGVFFLVVLAMGWAWSVYIAQTVARVIMSRAMIGFSGIDPLVYIDNFLLFGDTRAELANGVAVLKRRGRECGAVFKAEDHSPNTKADVLGMEVQMVDKTVRLCEAFAKKFRAFWEVYSLKPAEQTLRQTWKLFGGIFWAMRVLDLRQIDFLDMKRFMSRRARDLLKGFRKWEHKVVWWKAAWADVKRVCAIIIDNAPVTVEIPTAVWMESVWADASGSGGGFVLPEKGVVKSWKWSKNQLQHPIHLKEAWALERAVRHWRQLGQAGEGVHLKTDNVLVYLALRAKKASGFLFAGSIRATDDLLKGVEWTVEWVPSKSNIADAPSRGK